MMSSTSKIKSAHDEKISSVTGLDSSNSSLSGIVTSGISFSSSERALFKSCLPANNNRLDMSYITLKHTRVLSICLSVSICLFSQMAVLIPGLKYRFTDSFSRSSVPIDPMVCASVLFILLFLLVPKPVDQKCLLYEIETSVINVLWWKFWEMSQKFVCVSPWVGPIPATTGHFQHRVHTTVWATNRGQLRWVCGITTVFRWSAMDFTDIYQFGNKIMG